MSRYREHRIPDCRGARSCDGSRAAELAEEFERVATDEDAIRPRATVPRDSVPMQFGKIHRGIVGEGVEERPGDYLHTGEVKAECCCQRLYLGRATEIETQDWRQEDRA